MSMTAEQWELLKEGDMIISPRHQTQREVLNTVITEAGCKMILLKPINNMYSKPDYVWYRYSTAFEKYSVVDRNDKQNCKIKRTYRA